MLVEEKAPVPLSTPSHCLRIGNLVDYEEYNNEYNNVITFGERKNIFTFSPILSQFLHSSASPSGHSLYRGGESFSDRSHLDICNFRSCSPANRPQQPRSIRACPDGIPCQVAGFPWYRTLGGCCCSPCWRLTKI